MTTTTPVNPPARARLVTSPADRNAFTGIQETDARGALVRGLAEYLEGLSGIARGGRATRFKRVVEEWAEPEENAKFPSAMVTAQGDGTYDASSFTPVVDMAERLPGTDTYLVKLAEFTQDLQIGVWCTDKQERADLVAMLEEALNPVVFMYGFRLDLPFYFNSRATYELKGLSYADTDGEGIRRTRLATLTLAGSTPLIKLATFPGAQPRVVVEAFDPNDVVLKLIVS